MALLVAGRAMSVVTHGRRTTHSNATCCSPLPATRLPRIRAIGRVVHHCQMGLRTIFRSDDAVIQRRDANRCGVRVVVSATAPPSNHLARGGAAVANMAARLS